MQHLSDNNGMVIAWTQGVYNRIVEPFLNK